MFGRQGNSGQKERDSPSPPPWLVRAEVTIRHGNPVTSDAGQASAGTGVGPTATDPSGLRMVYRWNTNQPASAPIAVPSTLPSSLPPESSGAFGFQRGSIFFTSTPPSRPARGSFTLPRSGSSGNEDSFSSSRARGIHVSDSGYNSEQFSPQSYSSLPTRRPSQQYNRRCKSTCSIVLSTANVADSNNNQNERRAASDKRDSQEHGKEPSQYAGGGPWQMHRPQHPHVSGRCHFSTVPEVCEDCAEGSASSAFTTHFCTRVVEKTVSKSIAVSKDAASQTTDVESKCTSSISSKSGRVRRKATAGDQLSEQAKKRQESNSPSPSIGTSSPALLTEVERSDSSRDDATKRKSRTVHIDVYCTGSDDEDSSDSSSDKEKPAVASSTLFDSEDVKVTHTEVSENVLPRGFRDENAFLKRSAERRCDSFRHVPMRMPSLASSKGYESDDVLSSLYPSQFSSYSALRDLDSVPWSAASSSAAIPFDGYESTTATSSKDTFSDIESLINSRTSLTPCDSFEYANSADRERIRKMEALWATKGTKEDESKSWRSPHIERKHLLRNRKMREYLEKHDIGWSSGESAGESDESGAVGWSFVSSDDNSRVVKADSTVRRTSKDDDVKPVEQALPAAADFPAKFVIPHEDRSDSTTSRSDYIPNPYAHRDQIGPFGSKSPSPLPSKVPSRVTSPFTTPQGEKTDHIAKASIFGPVISAFRKPGHHIGPSKNPSCACEHCRRYFEELAVGRGRSRSVNELDRRPGRLFPNGRELLRPAPTMPRHAHVP